MKNNVFNSKTISLFVLLLFTFALLVSASYAWLTNFINVHLENDFQGSSVASYFAEGEGTEAKPYVINKPRHLYNLAWLQNQEPPVFTNNTYFKVCDNLENQNPIKLNMAGAIGGSMTATTGGAIPPIGTNTTPFKGHFDGCGSTISNLWVSTQKDDWKEQPHGDNEYNSTHVGLFGAISDGAIIENFVLDTVEVKSHFDATIGIVCGYVGANISKVGVYNGILNITAGANCQSEYSLIGEKSPNVTWPDMPSIDSSIGGGGDEAGGAIKIDINDDNLLNLFTEGESSTKLESAYVQVPDSATDRAFIVGADIAYASQQVNTSFYIHKETINSKAGAGKTYGTTKSNFQEFTASQYVENGTLSSYGIEINPDFKKRLDATTGGDVNTIMITTALESEASTEVTLETLDKNGQIQKVKIPTNSIWFKPIAKGNCIISFTVSNMGSNSDKYRSIYRFNRDSNGNIQNWSETKLIFKNTGGGSNKFKNKDLVAFQYYIDQDDVDAGYEFAIGASHDDDGDPINDSSISFFFLALAGASDTGGGEGGGEGTGETSGEMLKIDYVTAPTPNLTANANYENHKTLLRVSNATGTKIYYLAARTEDLAGEVQDPSTVYYHKTGTATVTDFSVGKQSDTAALGTKFGIDEVEFKDRDKSS